MKFRIRIILFILFTFVLVEGSEKFFPSRRELSDLEITRVIGLDEGMSGKDIKFSILRDIVSGDSSGNQESGDSSGGGSKSAESKKEELVSVQSSSFNTSLALLQNYTDKQFLGGHVKYVLLGEPIVKNQLRRVIDFLGRDNEIRLKTNMYIVKGTSADLFLSYAIDSDYIISDKLKNINSRDSETGLSHEVTLTDVTQLIIDKSISGVIPALELVGNGKIFNNRWSISSSEKSNNEFDFVLAGYGVIKDAKLVGYLTLSESRGYNYVKNKIRRAFIELDDEASNTKVVLSTDKIKTTIKSEFEGDGLKKVLLDVEVDSDIIEVDSQESIFKNEKFGIFEKKQSELIKSEIESMLNTSKYLNADIIELGKKIEIEHPYKWRKIKDKWNEIYPTIDFEVKVKSKFRRTYDLVESK